MKKIKYLVLSLVLAGAVVSCDNYLDINTSPNAPSAENVTPDLMLSGAINEPFEEITNRANELGNVFMNTWAGDVNNITGAYLDEFALNLTTNFHTDIWDRLYRNTGTLSVIARNTDPKYDNIKAIAKIMKVYYFQPIVDVYGDAPYFEAHLFGDNTNPAYTDDQAIYRDFIVQLDEAISLIDNASSNAVDPGVNDPIYAGSMSDWKKFANTLKLRVLLREATKAETNAASASYLTAQFANMANAQFVTSDVTLNPGYINENNRQNPFWGNFGFLPNGDPRFDNTLVVATDYVAKFMSGATTQNNVSTGLYDARIEKLFTPVSGAVVGVIQGDDNTTAPPALSHLGSGLLKSADQDSYIMTAAESYLLQAEAIQRGYLAGNAKDMFDAGVTASFNLLGADQSTYNNDGINLIGWTGSANKIEAIMTQKWIALCGINGLESWIEYTRTGFPAVPLATTAQQAAKPNRLLYPSSEHSGNAVNVPAQSQADAFSTHVFWDEN